MWEIIFIPIMILTTALLLEEDPQPPPAPAPAPADTVILLPNEDGSVGELVVQSDVGEQTLDRAFATVDVDQQGGLSTRTESESSVGVKFGSLLDATPQAPRSFVVTFESGSADQLTPESRIAMEEMRNHLLARPAPEILVIGHTDRVGSEVDNDRLSKSRADTVLALIEEAGVKATVVESSGRGEREPLVPTADSVAESRNRRVEISVR